MDFNEKTPKDIALEIKNDTKNQVNALETKVSADLKSVQESVDALAVEVKKAAISAEKMETKSGFFAAVEAKATELSNLGENKSVVINLDTKAAVDMFASAGQHFAGKLELGYQPDPTKPTSILSIVSGGEINVPSLSYVRITGYEGGPTQVAEGALKPKFSLTTSVVDASVKKTAVTAKFTEEATKDTTTFVSLVQSEMIRLHNEHLEKQVLFGSGTGNDLQGIFPLAKAFAAGSFAGTVESATMIDVIRVAIAQSRIALYTPSHVVMNPSDVAALELQKDNTGSYILPTIFSGSLPSIGRVQIIEMDDMPQGSYLVGAFDRGAKLYTREGLSVRIYDQNEDDAMKNMILVIMESRHVNLVSRPEAFIKGTFAAGITAINKAA